MKIKDEWIEALSHAMDNATDPADILEAVAPLIAAEARREALEEVAKFVQDRREDYISEHGSYDHSTGVTEFPGNGDETVGEWWEIEEAIRAMIDEPKPVMLGYPPGQRSLGKEDAGE